MFLRSFSYLLRRNKRGILFPFSLLDVVMSSCDSWSFCNHFVITAYFSFMPLRKWVLLTAERLVIRDQDLPAPLPPTTFMAGFPARRATLRKAREGEGHESTGGVRTHCLSRSVGWCQSHRHAYLTPIWRLTEAVK